MLLPFLRFKHVSWLSLHNTSIKELLLNNKKYKTLGGNNPGRPSDDNKGIKGYNIYKILK